VLGSRPMRSVLLSAALLVTGCRYDLDSPPEQTDSGVAGRQCSIGTSSLCMQAAMHSDFSFIKNQIFPISCSASSSCHMSATASGKLDLSAANAYKALVGDGTGGVMSQVDKTRVLVVPGMPKQSYLFFITRGLKAEDGDPPFSNPPANVGFMPQKGSSICCQKIDAIERWITAGAMND